jgi:hypothetical protein
MMEKPDHGGRDYAQKPSTHDRPQIAPVTLAIKGKSGNNLHQEKEEQNQVGENRRGGMSQSGRRVPLQEHIEQYVAPYFPPPSACDREKLPPTGILIPRKSPVNSEQTAQGKNIGSHKMDEPYPGHVKVLPGGGVHKLMGVDFAEEVP